MEHHVHVGERQGAALLQQPRLLRQDVEVEADSVPGEEGVAVFDLAREVRTSAAAPPGSSCPPDEHGRRRATGPAPGRRLGGSPRTRSPEDGRLANPLRAVSPSPSRKRGSGESFPSLIKE